MKQHTFKEDLILMYVTAESFPDDIFNAHQKLHSIVKNKKNRKYFGISFLDKAGKIHYKATVTENFEGEGMLLGLETLFIKKGSFHCITISQKFNEIAKNSFKILLFRTDLDFSENKEMDSTGWLGKLQTSINPSPEIY